jgi:hypothetical protein
MLRIHAVLWESTGSFEMLVFQTLLAGNIGQFGAPGTVVLMMGGGEPDGEGDGVVVGAGDDEAGDALWASAASAAPALAWRAPALGRTGLGAAAGDPLVAQPAPAAIIAATTAAAPMRRALVTKCPVSEVTVASWHGQRWCTLDPAKPSQVRTQPGWQKRPMPDIGSADLLYSGLPWQHAP